MKDFTFCALPPEGNRVALALSGGVDSSLALHLLIEAGLKPIGITMQTVVGQGDGKSCYAGGQAADIEACKSICAELGVDWFLIDLREAYEREILDYFRDEYLNARTPNPCIRCNPLLKFGLLPSALTEKGIEFDYIATGHYVRMVLDNKNRHYLATASDMRKDQSYFLQRLPSSLLPHLVFPLGGLSKIEVREAARARGLVSAEKGESQDFASRKDLPEIFSSRGGQAGNFVRRKKDGSLEVLGRHRGLEYYTIGQRRGLGIAIDSKPLYVLGLDAQKNEVLLGEDIELLGEGLIASDAVWQEGFPQEALDADGGLDILAKIRLGSPATPARLEPYKVEDKSPDSHGKDVTSRYKLSFQKNMRAISPGQSVAFYLPLNEEEGALRLIGGAYIDASIV